MIYNFGAGPAALPVTVLERIKADIPDWRDGISIMELSHRSSAVCERVEQIEHTLRRLLGVPEDYAVLFMSGGARTQFSVALLNLLNGASTLDYIVTGQWSMLAYEDAKRYCQPHCVASGELEGYTRIPEVSTWSFLDTSPFLHYTSNETIHGVAFASPPVVDKLSIVDMTSSIACGTIDFTRTACVYASAQKNLGIAGITVVIVRKDLLGKAHPLTPPTLNYEQCYQAHSMFNTPAVFAWYVLGLMLDWLFSKGGCEIMAVEQAQKAKLIYDVIDASAMYGNRVYPPHRSLVNIPFTLPTQALESKFLQDADRAGLKQLKGHKIIGGCRASMYNAMPLAGANCLAEFMRDFEKRA